MGFKKGLFYVRSSDIFSDNTCAFPLIQFSAPPSSDCSLHMIGNKSGKKKKASGGGRGKKSKISSRTHYGDEPVFSKSLKRRKLDEEAAAATDEAEKQRSAAAAVTAQLASPCDITLAPVETPSRDGRVRRRDRWLSDLLFHVWCTSGGRGRGAGK